MSKTETKESKYLIDNNPDAGFATFRKDNDFQNDKDFLVIGGIYHWIANHETLKYIMKNNSNATDIPFAKSVLLAKEDLSLLQYGENLDILV